MTIWSLAKRAHRHPRVGLRIWSQCPSHSRRNWAARYEGRDLSSESSVVDNSNQTALAIGAFATTLTTLGLFLMEWRGVTTTNVYIGNFFFVAG